ncbi:hypothetical protein HUJ04_011218 [Dendroctonus ponderosae]|nr:hypothetical protein HUJ04_011218 [Dendroctonus ponderosae]
MKILSDTYKVLLEERRYVCQYLKTDRCKLQQLKTCSFICTEVKDYLYTSLEQTRISTTFPQAEHCPSPKKCQVYVMPANCLQTQEFTIPDQKETSVEVQYTLKLQDVPIPGGHSLDAVIKDVPIHYYISWTSFSILSDSSRQSIVERMVKFKSFWVEAIAYEARKRGVKIWEQEQVDGTLGERVLYKLASPIKSKDVVLCYDRFFTSAKLMKEIKFPSEGTIMENKKNVPKFTEKVHRESQILGNKYGTICAKWQDTK